jgi:hypothetical protein
MLRMGRAVGNDTIQQRLQGGNTTRDELLAHICQRLASMRDAQRSEIGEADHYRQRLHWKEIADSHKPEYSKADPTRWREAAQLYDQAAVQLCRGALGTGAQLLDKAIEAERRAQEAMPKHLKKEAGEEAQRPGLLDEVVANQGCAPIDPPQALDLADQIIAVVGTFKDPPNKKRVPDPWWTDEEEEEEEGEGDGGAG